MFKKIGLKIMAAFGLIAATATSSFAVLSADQLAVTGALDTMIADLTTWAWSAVLAITLVMLGIKLFKKFAGKAT